MSLVEINDCDPFFVLSFFLSLAILYAGWIDGLCASWEAGYAMMVR